MRMSLLTRICSAALLALALGAVHAAPKLVPPPHPTDCAACHGADKVLPAQHPSIKGQQLADCRQCHDPASERRLKLSISHTHLLAGAGCDSCHGSGKPSLPETDQCRSCHDAKALVEKTANVKPKNPHTSPHYGPDLDCDNCHAGHGRSRDYCHQCHEFNFRVP